MRRAAKVDVNQPDIVYAFRLLGCSVQHLHTLGQGCPDLLIGCLGRNYLVEVKQDDGTLTDDETKWHKFWRGQVTIIRTREEVVEFVNHVRAND